MSLEFTLGRLRVPFWSCPEPKVTLKQREKCLILKLYLPMSHELK
jgi:hypothetical protein